MLGPYFGAYTQKTYNAAQTASGNTSRSAPSRHSARMRRLRRPMPLTQYYTATTLDGFIADPTTRSSGCSRVSRIVTGR
jgi:hypothetical protein